MVRLNTNRQNEESLYVYEQKKRRIFRFMMIVHDVDGGEIRLHRHHHHYGHGDVFLN